MQEKSLRSKNLFYPRAIMAVMVLLSISVVPALAAGAADQQMTMIPAGSSSLGTTAHATIPNIHAHPAILMKWWQWLIAAVVTIAAATVVVYFPECADVAIHGLHAALESVFDPGVPAVPAHV